jgi:hypothetical protein
MLDLLFSYFNDFLEPWSEFIKPLLNCLMRSRFPIIRFLNSTKLLGFSLEVQLLFKPSPASIVQNISIQCIVWPTVVQKSSKSILFAFNRLTECFSDVYNYIPVEKSCLFTSIKEKVSNIL